MVDTKESCMQYIPLLDAYRDGELEENERAPVQAHLNACDHCCKRVDEINRLVAAIKEVPPLVAPRDYADQIEAILAKRNPTKKAGNVVSIGSAGKGRPIIWVAAVAASMLLTFGLAQLLTSNNSVSVEVARSSDKTDSSGSNVHKNATASLPQGAGNAMSNNNETNPANQIASSRTSVKNLLNPTRDHGASSAHDQVLSNAVTGTEPGLRAPAATNDHSTAPSTASSTAPSTTPSTTPSTAPSTTPSTTQTTAHPAIQMKYQGQIADKNGNREDTGDGTPNDVDNGHSLVAYYEQEQSTMPEALGISTDEDGLYAIKM